MENFVTSKTEEYLGPVTSGYVPGEWSIQSWKSRPVTHSLPFGQNTKLPIVLEKIAQLPPLVCSDEVDRLRSIFKAAEEGSYFILQGGDCAERFSDCLSGPIVDKVKVLLQMAMRIELKAGLPVAILGRMAGQYCKPRTQEFENFEVGRRVLTYRGDMCHGFDIDQRTPNPDRIRMAYDHSGLTLNFVRALLNSELSSFSNIPELHLSWDRPAPSLKDVSGVSLGEGKYELGRRFFVSHEGLFLDFESALTKSVPRKSGSYNLSAHMHWIGDKTRQVDGGHVEFFRGLRNPVGVKLGPTATEKDVEQLSRILNPNCERGKLVFITRLGVSGAAKSLKRLIRAQLETRVPCSWICDPMHGNTKVVSSGRKTRAFNDILEEYLVSSEIHKELGSHLGGVHLEMTGENVTECIGGAGGVRVEDLDRAYETWCDPRLNYHQSMEFIESIRF